jgi:hypothetical protein
MTQMADELYFVRSDLDEMKQLLIQRPLPLFADSAPPSRPMSPMPLEDDDRLNVTIESAKSTTDPAKNLMISVALISGNILDLPLELLEYGLSQGDINPAIVEQKRAMIAPKPAQPAQAKAIAAPAEFETALDDLDGIDW